MTNAIPFILTPTGGQRMADLMIARPDGELLLTRPLHRGTALVVGRHPRNGIVLSDDRISRRHALIFDHDGAWFAVDLDSTAGLVGPAGPVRLHRFDPADPWIQLGPAVLWVDHGTNRPVRTVEPGPQDTADDSPPSDSRDDLLLAHLDLSTPEPDVRLLDPSGVDRVLVGAHPACDLVVDEEGVADLDCILYREGRHWAVADLGFGGVAKTGRPSRNRCRTRLFPGFQRRIGSSRLTVLRPDRLRRATPEASTNDDPHAISGLLREGVDPGSEDSPNPPNHQRVA